MIKLRLFYALTIIAFLCGCSKEKRQYDFGVVAHQGYWQASEGASNSIRGMEEAARLNLDGVELDIRKTRDNALVLCHDPKYGKYTVAETDLEKLRTIHMPDGSVIPTLEEYLSAAVNFPELCLFIDVKTADCVAPVCDLVVEYKVQDRARVMAPFSSCVSSIDANIGIKAVCIDGGKTPEELSDAGFWGVAYSIDVFKSHPDWISEAKRNQLETSVWVIKSETEMIWAAQNKFDFVITDSPLECKKFVGQ